MNAITPITSAFDETAWTDALGAVNTWRGQAIYCFAKAEFAVSETLLALASLPTGGTSVRLRPLVGQRFEDLRAAVDAGGPFGGEGAKAAAALADFRQYEDLRPYLCHGLAKIAMDKHGQWLVVLRLLAFRGRNEERSSVTYERREAEAILAELRTASQRLAASLQSLRDRTRD